MKRLFSFVLMAVLMLSLWGCGQDGGTSAPPSAQSSEQPSADSSKPYQMMISTMSPGTITYVTTGSFTPYFMEVLPEGSRIERTPTATGDISGLYLIRAGQSDMYIPADLSAHWVWEGKDYPGIDGAYQGFRKLLQFEAFAGTGFFVSKSLVEQHNLKTVDDLLSKGIDFTMATWPNGSASVIMAEQILSGYGYDNLEDFKSQGHQVLQGAAGDLIKYIRDRQANVYFGLIAGLDFPPVEEMTTSVDLVLLPYGEQKLKEISEQYGYSPFTIPKGEYNGVEQDTVILGTAAYINVSEEMPDDIAYKLTKVLYDNWEELQKTDPFLSITPLHFRETMIPFHPGAEKYLKEVGALK